MMLLRENLTYPELIKFYRWDARTHSWIQRVTKYTIPNNRSTYTSISKRYRAILSSTFIAACSRAHFFRGYSNSEWYSYITHLLMLRVQAD